RAVSVLGADHPLARIAALAHALACQAATTSALVVLGVLAVAEGRSWGGRLFGAALVVELALLGMFACVRQNQREHALRLIAGGYDRLPLLDVSREVSRLARPLHARQLAARLERAFDDAEGWHQLAVACRPPVGIRVLCSCAPEVGAIVALLRARPAM